MSSHFNYEIDERSLRVRLKDMSIPPEEEAWVQFENYSESCKHTGKTGRSRFQLNVNRNVILPVVFGVVIISFSLLLFNFVSIKNKKTNDSEIKTASLEIKKEEPKKLIVPLVKIVDTTSQLIVQKTDSSQLKTIAAQSIITEAVTLSVQNSSLQSKAELSKNVSSQIENKNTIAETTQKKISPDLAWTTTESAEIFSRPDNKSEVLGNASSNHQYEAIEQTNYYIKVSFQSNGINQLGYIKKQQLRKKSDEVITSKVGKKKRSRKAEILESLHVPTSLPNTDTKEPELK